MATEPKTCTCGKHTNMHGNTRLTGSSIRPAESERHSSVEACVVMLNGSRYVLHNKGLTIGQNLDSRGWH